MLSETQKQKILKNLQGKNLFYFFMWIIIFTSINYYFNELGVVGFRFLKYSWEVKVPYIFFGMSNALLIGLSMNLLIDKFRELRTLNPGAGIFSLGGTFFALLTGACPGCIAGVFPAFVGLFGSNISLYSLPMKGVELQALSFVFLLIGIYFLSRDMSCKIPRKTT